MTTERDDRISGDRVSPEADPPHEGRAFRIQPGDARVDDARDVLCGSLDVSRVPVVVEIGERSRAYRRDVLTGDVFRRDITSPGSGAWRTS